MLNSRIWKLIFWITGFLMIAEIFIIPALVFKPFLAIAGIIFMLGTIAFHGFSLVKYRQYLVEEELLMSRLKR
jgi:hypothetical protein